MKKWALWVAMASLGAGLVGCAGNGVPDNGGGGGGGGGTGGGDGRSTASVNLPAGVPGLIDVTFLPGQGRDVGSPTAVIRRVYFYDIDGNRAEDELNPDTYLKLDGFNAINRRVNALFGYFDNSKRYVNYQLEVQKLGIDNGDGTFTYYEGNQGNPILSGNTSLFNNALSMSVFAGRTTALQIYLNDAILNHDGVNLTWDRTLFQSLNTNPTTGKITGFLSDYLMFDISNVAAKPSMQSPDALGQDAQRFYISGDAFALSQAPDADPTVPKVFETLTPFGAIDGNIRYIGAPANFTQYELKQADPRFIDPPRLITALKGKVRPFAEVISNAGQFEFITLPKNVDGTKQDLVMFLRSSTAANAPITQLWFGEVDLGATPNPTFRAWPIDQLDDANRTGEVNGYLPVAKLLGPGKAPIDTKGFKWFQNLREGDFVFTTVPPGLPSLYNSGRFIVFRK